MIAKVMSTSDAFAKPRCYTWPAWRYWLCWPAWHGGSLLYVC